VTAVACPGISVAVSGPRVAEATMLSWTGAGVGCGEGGVAKL